MNCVIIVYRRSGQGGFVMRRLSMLLVLVLLSAFAVPCAMGDEELQVGDYYYEGNEATQSVPYGAPQLTSLTHNCPNTGKMLPEYFSPSVTTYLLTVASWVSRVQFTPVSSDPYATIYVNGAIVRSGAASSYFKMTDNPQQVQIDVVGINGLRTSYTVYLQRRPSDRRTRVSAGYIENIYQKSGKWYIDADLGTVTYGAGNESTFVNKTTDHYRYACTDSCVFYYGSMSSPYRAYNISDFMAHAAIGSLCRFIYIEDEIVAVLPYAPDY